ncbi:MAG: Gfo/Idh/MocA family oxidoreductase [Pirellulales bacterium]|nr:Gfo/Idh/MocA family oxidoreductase [Pirellulales bacterium]
MASRSNRRDFMKTTAATGIGFWVAAGLQAEESKSPNEAIAMASIGIGGKGSSDSKDAGKFGRMVAICDVDEKRLETKGKTEFPQAKLYTDYRKMLEEMGDKIDAVTVSTPDHNHAPASLMAMRMGKHCFCQKPLTRTIYEARLMAQVAKEKKLATQMGNQGTALSSLRKAAAVIKNGTLGTVKEVHVWTNRPIWPQGGPRPEEAKCPAGLKWDEWIGPAPMRPYARGVYHPFAWRGWWDFGCGALGDMACHTMNMPFMALDLRDPISIQAETSKHNKDSYPKSSKIEFVFPANSSRPAVNFSWYDGGNLPAEELIREMKVLFKEQIEEARKRGDNYLSSGCVVVGEKANFYVPGDYAERLLKLSGNQPLPDPAIVESPGHFEEWVRAIKGGEPAMSNFPDYSGPLTEMVLVGNLAVWVAAAGQGEKVLWDSKNMKCTNIAGLESLIKPTYRAGYTLDV